MRELRKRSIAKAVSYRIICIVMLALITYLITGNLIQMTSIVVVFSIYSMIIYYVHERAWEQIEWGYY